MRILVVNPNSTGSMTEAIGAHARAVVGPGVSVEAVHPPGSPASIESHTDDVLAAPGVLAEIARRPDVDGFVVACFGDPGLLAAREIASGPVVGIAEAGMRTACYLGRSFSVVTTLHRTVGHIRDLAAGYGVGRQCAGVHASGVAVLDLETDPTAYVRVLTTARAALAADGSDSLVLGCAGMADLTGRLAADLGVPVVDGVAAATTEVERLVRLGLATGKTGEFATPRLPALLG
ncbi:aspartate/glutamate racemase family protein [Nocardioides fonticola]|uniref:Aspartate/glutamate racemase family protein n=1 Tax=Nocardioides fonticola TaxID=450363 RepID=A0ABP7XHW3_9ACTN